MTRPTMHNPDPDAVDHPSATTDRPNLSTEHQEEGDAKRPSDTLDRDQSPGEDDGGRKTSFTQND